MRRFQSRFGIEDVVTNHFQPYTTLFAWACLAYKPYFFNHRTIIFSHIKSANSTFSHSLSAKQAQANH